MVNTYIIIDNSNWIINILVTNSGHDTTAILLFIIVYTLCTCWSVEAISVTGGAEAADVCPSSTWTSYRYIVYTKELVLNRTGNKKRNGDDVEPSALSAAWIKPRLTFNIFK